MPWTLTVPDADLSVELKPVAGDIKVVEEQTTAVHHALRGSSPWVADTPRRAATISVPELFYRSAADVDQLRIIRALSRRCLLVDKFGREFPVRFSGPVSQRIPDGPDDLIYVTVAFVGVA